MNMVCTILANSLSTCVLQAGPDLLVGASTTRKAVDVKRGGMVSLANLVVCVCVCMCVRMCVCIWLHI
jgi:hypothetical protein